jgi:YggT family protein
MNSALIVVITTLTQVLSLLIIVDSLLSFALPPYHPIRDAMGRVLNPLYNPIRRILPMMGTIDFSPLVLLILVQVVQGLLVNFLSR